MKHTFYASKSYLYDICHDLATNDGKLPTEFPDWDLNSIIISYSVSNNLLNLLNLTVLSGMRQK